MLIYLEIRNMTFKEEDDSINHEIVIRADKETFDGYDRIAKVKAGALKISDNGISFVMKEQNTWYNFPLYEYENGEIIDFDYTKYLYFADTERRVRLVDKISDLYHPSSEAKIIRRTLKIILNHLGMVDEKFEKYDTKVEAIIKNNPKI